MNKNKILVVGGCGFVGRHLVTALQKEYEQVDVLDLVDGTFRGYEQSSNNMEDIEPVYDIIYHLGEYARVESSFSDIEEVVFSNLRGTPNVIDFARKCKAKLIYTATSSEFCSEGDMLTPYTWSKVRNRDLIKAYGEWFELDYAIAYLYNVYGMDESHNTVVGKFKKLYRQGCPLRINGDGKARRNFTHISDTVAGLMLVGEAGYGDGWGIGHDKSWSIQELAGMFAHPVKYLSSPKGNRKSSNVLLTKKIKELGWEAKIKLDEHIEEWILKN